MGHIVHAKEEVYRALAERLHKCPEGAHINEDLMAILYRLYSENEAMVGSKFPMIPITLRKIARITGMPEEALEKTLDGMAEKGLLIDLPRRDATYYTLAPMVIGFFEYTFMRVKTDVNLREMAELFDKYFQNPEAGMELVRSDTKLFQTLVYESLIPFAVETEVLNYERASEIIRRSGGGSLSMCACRHKAIHLGKDCAVNAPLEVCTTLGKAAEWIVRRGMGKPATVDELLRVLDETEKLGLVHLGDNVLNEPAYICHCCTCCCGPLIAAKEYGVFMTHPSNFIPVVEKDNCTGCASCVDKCPIKAIAMSNSEGVELAEVIQQKCIGCGVCASACPSGALSMSRRSVIHVPPENKIEQLTRMAREKGKL